MLKSGDPQQTQQMIKQLSGEVNNIVESVIELCYYMRGAITYDEMMNRTSGERDRISTFVHERLDSQKKSMHPVY